MTTTGLTADGFIAETFQSIRETFRARLRVEFGAGLPLDASTIEGQSVDILTEQITKLWELAEAVYSSQDPDKATGAALDALCTLTGTIRHPPSFSVGRLALAGDPATDVPSNTQLRIGAAGAVVAVIADTTLDALPAWTPLTPFAKGALITNGGNVYLANNAGTSGNNTSPSLDREPTHTSRPLSMAAPLLTADGLAAPDGSIVWIWVAAGTAGATGVDAVAIVVGPTNIESFAISDVVTPVVGLSGGGNPLDFELGKDLQTDESLRTSREDNLAAPGTGTRDAIRAAILALDDVVSCTIFVNATDVVDADGVPPHAIEALVRGGDDQAVRDCLLSNVAAGIRTFGNTSGLSVDSEGTSHVVDFSRPVEIPIYVAITLTYNAKKYPSDGDAAVSTAVVTFGDEQDTGKDAVAQSIGAQSNTIDGVLEVTDVKISTTPGPVSSATIAISLRQLAVFDTSRVSVSSSAVTP